MNTLLMTSKSFVDKVALSIKLHKYKMKLKLAKD